MTEPYPFRFPAEMPSLTYAGLEGIERIGSTVRVVTMAGGTRVLRLYRTSIAWIEPESVYFAKTGDTHQATRMWLEHIVQDNGIGRSVYRDRRGVLVIDGGAKVEGERYAVGKPTVRL